MKRDSETAEAFVKSKCCEEGGCHRAKPFLFTRTPTGRWLLITRYHLLEGDDVEVLDRHDVTDQIDNILGQYRNFLDQELQAAMVRQSEAFLEEATAKEPPKLILPSDVRR